MATVSYKEKDRFFISFIIALVVHIIALTGLHFILNIRVEALPEYSGPMYLEIGPEFRHEVVVEHTDGEKKEETLDKADEQETAGNAKRDEARTDGQRDDDNDVSALVSKDDREENEPESEEAGPEENSVNDRWDAEIRDADEKTEDTSGNEENSDRGDKDRPDETPMDTPEPTLTPTPYDPAIEEENLAQLDKLLENGTPDDRDSVDDANNNGTHTQGSDTTPEEGGGPLIEWEDNRDRKPLITYEPDIPGWVSREGKELQVEVSFLLTPDGLLTSLRVIKSSGYTDVDSSIVEALRKWKFSSVSGTGSVRGRITYFIGLK